MRATFAWSPAETISLLPSFRLVFGALDVRMCRVFVWPRLILRVPVLLKRLAAPEWVFNLGILLSMCGPRPSRRPVQVAHRTGTSLPLEGFNQYIPWTYD